MFPRADETPEQRARRIKAGKIDDWTDSYTFTFDDAETKAIDEHIATLDAQIEAAKMPKQKRSRKAS